MEAGGASHGDGAATEEEVKAALAEVQRLNTLHMTLKWFGRHCPF